MQGLKAQIKELPEQLDDIAEFVIETVAQKWGNNEQSEEADVHLEIDSNAHFNIDTIDEQVNNTLVHMKCMMLEKELARCRQLNKESSLMKKSKSDNPSTKHGNQKQALHSKQRNKPYQKSKQTASTLKKLEKQMDNIIFG